VLAALPGVGALVGCIFTGLLWVTPQPLKRLHAELTAGPSGFAQSRYAEHGGEPLSFYNSAEVPLTVCLGSHGACDPNATKPQRLRAPGARIPAHSHIVVTLPDEDVDLRLTMVGGGPPTGTRDTVLHVTGSTP